MNSPRFFMLRNHNIVLLGVTLSQMIDYSHSSQSRRKVYNASCQSNRRGLHNTNSGEYDVAIIGGGVVGLSVAYHLAAARKELRIVVLEKEDSVAAGASSGNSGLGCTGYDAPEGSVESQLLRRSIRLHPALYRSFGLRASADLGGHVRKCGSLVVAWTQEEEEKLSDILRENQRAGDQEARLLTREELREEAPELSKEARGGVLCPYEAVVEPWLVPVGFAVRARALGVNIITGRKVTSLRHFSSDTSPNSNVTGSVNVLDRQTGMWGVQTQATSWPEVCSSGRSKKGAVLVERAPANSGNSSQTEEISAKVVINCAGLYGDEIEKMRLRALNSTPSHACGEMEVENMVAPSFTVTPRKGQFVVFRPKADILSSSNSSKVNWQVPTMIIEPVPTERTKGVILWQTVYGTVVVGPTAVDQKSKDDRSTDAETLNHLIEKGRRLVPALEHWEVIGSYSGLRPSTEHRDYQIHANKEQQWICVGGIRSTGLTAATGIGEHVVKNLFEKELLGYTADDVVTCTGPDAAGSSAEPFAIMGVSQSTASTLPLASSAMPEERHPPFQFDSLAHLSEQYMNSNTDKYDGKSRERYLEFDGFKYRVTHPISSFGMENYRSIADIHSDEHRSDDND